MEVWKSEHFCYCSVKRNACSGVMLAICLVVSLIWRRQELGNTIDGKGLSRLSNLFWISYTFAGFSLLAFDLCSREKDDCACTFYLVGNEIWMMRIRRDLTQTL